MFIDLQGNKTVVSRLRLHAATSDPGLAMQRLRNLLSSAHLHPSGLTPSAIVFIRRLYDPMPGALRLDQSGGNLPAVWDRAARELLDRQVGGAVRPALGAVSASTNAVVFLDRSELLACLASDWCEGSVTTRWWWQSLLKQGAATQIVKELWRRDPQYVPAALQQLAEKNKAADFVRALSDTEARQLLRGIAKSFALPALISMLDDFEGANTGRDSLEPNQPKTATRQMNNPVTTPAGPWRPWVPECRVAELRPDQEFFFAIALMLRRAPVKVRAPEFQARVREWQQEILLARAGKFVPISLDEQLVHTVSDQSHGRARAGSQVNEAVSSSDDANYEPIEADSATPAKAADGPIDIKKLHQDVGQPLQAEPPEAEFRPKASRLAEEFASPSPARSNLQPGTTTKTERSTSDSKEREIGSQPSFASSEAPSAQSGSPNATGEAAQLALDEVLLSTYDETSSQLSATVIAENDQDEEWVATQLGGVFYLVNLGLSLGFYGDFTTPGEPGIQLSIWDFVALLGRELVGEEIESDAIWSLLQRLAQREEADLLGSGFEPEAVLSFEFPASNVELNKVELNNAPTLAALPKPRDQDFKTQNSKPDTAPQVAAWVDRLMPYVRARLRQALGLAEVDNPGPIVCRLRARVCLTPTHLDVFFFLAELPIEIRVAGLDRNPGWVPAAGRFIAFHFD